MDKMLDIIQQWYDQNEGEISFDTSLYYLIELFQELKEAGLTKDQLSDVGERLLFLLKLDMVDKLVNMIQERMVAKEISLAYRIVNKKIDEYKDEPAKIEQVVQIEDGDIYPNNTSEPDIDLRGVEWDQIPDDEEFLRELGIKNER